MLNIPQNILMYEGEIFTVKFLCCKLNFILQRIIYEASIDGLS